MFERHTHAEHAEDEEDEIPLDGGVGFLGFKHARHEEHDATGEGGDFEGGDVPSDGGDDGGDDTDDEGDLARGGLGWSASAVEEHQIVTIAEPINGLVRAHHEEHVAGFDGQGFDRLADVATFPVQGDRDHPETLSEVYASHGLTDERGLRSGNGLNEGAFLGGDLFKPELEIGEEIDALDTTDVSDIVGTARQNHPVTGVELGRRGVERNGNTMAHQFEHSHAPSFLKAGFVDGFAGQGGVGLDESLSDVFAALLLAQNISEHLTHGEHAFAHDGEVDTAKNGGRDAQPGEFKEGKGTFAMGDGDAVYDQIGTGAYEGAGPSQNGGVGKRNEELGRGQFHLPGQTQDHGQEYHDDRGVVDEGR